MKMENTSHSSMLPKEPAHCASLYTWTGGLRDSELGFNPSASRAVNTGVLIADIMFSLYPSKSSEGHVIMHVF